MSRASFLESVMNDPGKLEYGPHGDTAMPTQKRSKKENARRKQVRERLERGLQRRKELTPEMIAAEAEALREQIAQILDARRARDQAA
ncbi:hypothetical protein LCGC14_0279530 [marine sediment metagenome]|uniref:Uncharacterized protein n=2 Tax=root TaxID=1 RepID=A0A7V1BG60_9RHOB|nr:hypothetical protein [Sulfitobacter litoralis]HDZ52646.1 hypothetical protein [Sulfitobacter litoralis]